MRIVDRATFLAMPADTVFSKYEPHVFGELAIKGDSIGDPPFDFFVQQIADAVAADSSGEFADILEARASDGGSFDLCLDCEGRDGLFDDDQLFAVWEDADVQRLVERLSGT